MITYPYLIFLAFPFFCHVSSAEQLTLNQAKILARVVKPAEKDEEFLKNVKNDYTVLNTLQVKNLLTEFRKMISKPFEDKPEWKSNKIDGVKNAKGAKKGVEITVKYLKDLDKKALAMSAGIPDPKFVLPILSYILFKPMKNANISSHSPPPDNLPVDTVKALSEKVDKALKNDGLLKNLSEEFSVGNVAKIKKLLEQFKINIRSPYKDSELKGEGKLNKGLVFEFLYKIDTKGLANKSSIGQTKIIGILIFFITGKEA